MSENLIQRVSKSVKHWYLLLILGLILIAAGFFSFTAPEATYVTLAVFFSASFLITGVVEVAFALANTDTLKNWGWMLVFGILNIVVGAIMLRDPNISMVTLPFYVGFMLLFRSIAAMGYSLDMKSAGLMDWGNLLAVGILGMIFSFILLFNPAFAGISIVVWTGLAFMTLGIFSIYMAFRLKKIHKLSKEVQEKFQ